MQKKDQNFVDLSISQSTNLGERIGQKFLKPRNVANKLSGNSTYLNYTSPQYNVLLGGAAQKYQQLYTLVDECDSLQADYKHVCYPYKYDRVKCDLSIGAKETKICEILVHDVFPDQPFCDIGYLPINESYCMAVKDCAHTWQRLEKGLTVKYLYAGTVYNYQQDVWKCYNDSGKCDYLYI